MPSLPKIPYIVIGAVAFILIASLFVLFGFLPGKRAPAPARSELSVWGPDSAAGWNDLFARFHELNPQVSISYQQIPAETYEDTLVNKLAAGQGPDIFILKNSWIQKHKDKIYPLPQDTLKFTANDFRAQFVDAATDDLVTQNGNIVGLPLTMDTPALFYNRDMLNAAGIALPPASWNDLEQIARIITQKTAAGDITRSGIAIGTAANVEHSFDILSSLFLQYGDPIIGRTDQRASLGAPSEQALTFYAGFATPFTNDYSWSARSKNSLDAFAEGSAALAIGVPKDVKRIQLKNPYLDFGVAAFPQRGADSAPRVYARYFFPTVSRTSPNASSAWQFLIFAASREGAEIYLDTIGGAAPARRDLMGKSDLSPLIAPFWRQALIAKTWPVPNEQAAEQLFSDAITSVISGSADARNAVSRIRGSLQLLTP